MDVAATSANRPQSLVPVCTCLVSITQRIGECSAANSFAICILVGEVTLVCSDGVADQLECQVLEVVLVVRVPLENFFRVAFSGKNVAVVGAGHQEVVEDSMPPFLK